MLTSDVYRYGVDQGTRASQPNHLGRRGSDPRLNRDLVAISLDEAPQRASERRTPATTAGAGGAPTAPH